MFEYIDRINIDTALKSKIIDLAQTDKTKILSLAQKCNAGNFSCLKHKNDLLRLAVIIECVSETAEKYKSLGIDEKIMFDTLDDIRIWCENNDNKGLKNYNWIKNHINCQLFKLGRLQYQIFPCRSKILKYNLLPFNYGDNLIYVHIPQGEKLDYSMCINSLIQSTEFFAKYFPEYKYRFYFCESWLLYEENWQFMKAQSNILQFASIFDVLYSVENNSQAIERIFGKRQHNKHNYPENTTLQKNAKEFLLNKGRLGIGVGIVDKYALL